MPKVSKKELLNLIKDHKVQLLIGKFISGELDILSPVYDPKRGFYYPVVDKILDDSSKTDDFLKKLFKGGVLKRQLYDKVLYCPFCRSANISIHYTCPHCQSFDIRKSALVEHIKCGYIDTEDNFQVGEKLICPKCGKDLITPGVDHHKAGIWCSCNQCTKSFDIPVPAHFCRECRENFTFEEAVYKNVYSYSLTPEASKEATRDRNLIGPIMEVLEEMGYNVESPGFLNGKSGTTHRFDLTAASLRMNRITVIDLKTSNDTVSEQAVISMFAKVFDTNPEKACLVAIPKINESGRKLANLYKIELIEAKDQNEAVEALKICISK